LREGNQPLACYEEPTATGQHLFTLTVSDGHGGVDSDDLAIYLVAPPTVTLLAPAQGAVVPAGQPYTVRWSATSEDPLEGFLVYGTRDGSGVPFPLEGCEDLDATARECTWTSTGAPTAEAQIYIEAFDVSRQVGVDSSGPFVIAGSGGVPTGWQNRDIGAVARPGSASFDGGVFTVTGSGADIWGTADEFHYAYTSVSGDFDVVVRVASIENVNQWTKAGVMIREGTGAGARHASLFITPTSVKGVAFQRRPTAGGASVHTAGPSFAAPGWVRLVRDGNTVTAYYHRFPGESWELIGTQAFTGLAETLLVGLAVSSHVDGRLATATFDNVTLTRDRFQSVDIGAVGVPGTTSLGTSAVTIEGAGSDIWGTADAFRYYYRPWTGDGTITVRVASIENTHAWAKAGVMFRETLGASARHVMAIVSPGKGVAVQYRGATGGASANVALAAGAAPEWLRLTRAGNLFTAAASENGTTWQTLGSVTIPMASPILVGLPVTSHYNATLATAVFDHPVVAP
jgi:regulation of enolase protein 1 (concanavalin A-like superfamily)